MVGGDACNSAMIYPLTEARLTVVRLPAVIDAVVMQAFLTAFEADPDLAHHDVLMDYRAVTGVTVSDMDGSFLGRVRALQPARRSWPVTERWGASTRAAAAAMSSRVTASMSAGQRSTSSTVSPMASAAPKIRASEVWLSAA